MQFEFDRGDPILDIAVEWTPKVKGRPRFNRSSGKAYTPKDTLDAEREIADAVRAALPDCFEPSDTLMRIEWTFTNTHIGIRVWPTEDYESRSLRGDLDNYVKIVSDALNGVLYQDDKQIVAMEARKL